MALAFTPALYAQDHRRKVNAPHLLGLVRASVKFRDGEQLVPDPKHKLLLEDEELLRIAA